MDTNGPIKPPETPSPTELILQQKKDALQGLPQLGGDGGDGILAQLSSNPFFTAVSEEFPSFFVFSQKQY
jgi:hypothetical protein